MRWDALPLRLRLCNRTIGSCGGQASLVCGNRREWRANAYAIGLAAERLRLTLLGSHGSDLLVLNRPAGEFFVSILLRRPWTLVLSRKNAKIMVIRMLRRRVNPYRENDGQRKIEACAASRRKPFREYAGRRSYLGRSDRKAVRRSFRE